jgi:hypothetical protein
MVLGLFRGFVFSGMSLFNIIYELTDNYEKLYFDNPLVGELCKTTESGIINVLLDTLAKSLSFVKKRAYR